MAELASVQQWMYTQLSSDATINAAVGSRIYANAAPQNTIMPLLTFAYIGGVDVVHTIGNTRATMAIYLVRAVAKGNSTAPIEAAAARFDALLDPGMGVTVDGVKIRSCVHDQPHIRSDGEYGVPAVYLGSYYRVYFHPADQ